MKRIAVVALGLVVGACQWFPGTASNEVRAGKQAVADSLRDPNSAQFRNVKRYPQKPTQDSTMKVAVCGEVNGKNLNGAYVGFTRFIADPHSSSSLLDPQITATQEEADHAAAACRQAADRARRTGFAELAKFQCEQSLNLSRERLEQAEFEVIFSQRCTADPPAS